MINFMELGTTTFEDGIAGGMEPGDAAQAAGQACMDAATDAGFPPDMCQACLDAGTQAFENAMANGMPPVDCMAQAMQGGMQAGQDHFDGPDMPDFDAIGQEAFNDALDGGASAADAGQAAADAIQAAGTEAGIPPEIMSAGLEAAGDAFQDALAANPDDPQGAFEAAMDAGGSAADGVMMEAGFEMGPEGEMGPPGGPPPGEPGGPPPGGPDMGPDGPPGGPPPGEPGGPPPGGPDMDSVTQAMDGEVDAPPMPDGPDMPDSGPDGGDVPPPDDTGDEVV